MRLRLRNRCCSICCRGYEAVTYGGCPLIWAPTESFPRSDRNAIRAVFGYSVVPSFRIGFRNPGPAPANSARDPSCYATVALPKRPMAIVSSGSTTLVRLPGIGLVTSARFASGSGHEPGWLVSRILTCRVRRAVSSAGGPEPPFRALERHARRLAAGWPSAEARAPMVLFFDPSCRDREGGRGRRRCGLSPARGA